jgi:ketosteroid isomerase-like protein
MSESIEIAKAIYRAYVAKDRAAAERLLAEEFRFTSPLDNGLDRATYFAVCWPGSEMTNGIELIHLVEAADHVFVTYESELSGKRRFRNTEVLTIRGGKIVAVEVYFGWNLPHDVPSGRHRDP